MLNQESNTWGARGEVSGRAAALSLVAIIERAIESNRQFNDLLTLHGPPATFFGNPSALLHGAQLAAKMLDQSVAAFGMVPTLIKQLPPGSLSTDDLALLDTVFGHQSLNLDAMPNLALAWPAIKGRLEASAEDWREIDTPLQSNILKALDGQALKKQALADRVCGGEGTRLYRPGGIKELRKAGRVAHKNGVGYYRPDAPPPDSTP